MPKFLDIIHPRQDHPVPRKNSLEVTLTPRLLVISLKAFTQVHHVQQYFAYQVVPISRGKMNLLIPEPQFVH